MASTSDSLPSSPSLPTTAGLDAAGGGDQEFSSYQHHQSLFLPSSSSSYLDSPFHGLLHTSSSSSATMSPSQAPPPHPPPPAPTSNNKPPKKRPRASRRPPTTVLTTDTSNFRAMVQEFTGIPSPPFVAGVGAPAASLRTRFDHLFPSPASALRSAAAGDPASSLPPYLLRPFAQKLPTAASPFPPYTSSSSSTPLSTSTPSSSNLAAANANATTTSTAAATTATSVNPTAAAGAGDTFQLTPAALLRMQHDATSSSGSYLSFPSAPPRLVFSSPFLYHQGFLSFPFLPPLSAMVVSSR